MSLARTVSRYATAAKYAAIPPACDQRRVPSPPALQLMPAGTHGHQPPELLAGTGQTLGGQ